MGARPSEIRRFLLKHAEKKGIRVQEFVSDEIWRPVAYFCHLEIPQQDELPRRTATSISHEAADNALVMAFLYLGNPEIDFLD